MNIDFYRSLFPITATHIHLASCSQGALAKPVSRAIEDYHHELLVLGNNWKAAMRKAEEARKKFAKLIGAEADEIALVASVSDAISAVAASLSAGAEKRKISFTDIDFPTVGHIWLAQESFKEKISIIRSYHGEIPLEQYEKDVTADTLITCIPHVSYYNGYKQNLEEIARIVHQKGSLLFVDAYQSAGHIPIHVKEMKIDLLTAGTRKYMLGIPGAAFLYIRKELAEQLKPQITGWLGQDPTSAFDIERPVFAAGTRRFETGTPSFISIYAACSALDLLLEIGVGQIEADLTELSRFTIQYGQEKGLELIGPANLDQRSSLVAFQVGDAAKAEAMLRDKKVIVSARKDVIRIAPHFYNTQEEIQHALDELAVVLKKI